ncbi:MAG: DUF4332 domain-containing protein [Candidatus Helarchaeota archaeon]
MQDEVDDVIEELNDMIDWHYYTFALQKFEGLEDKTSERSIKIKQKILEGILEETKDAIEYKFKRLNDYIKNKNFLRLQVELRIIAKNLDYLKEQFKGLDPDFKIVRELKRDLHPWKGLLEDFEKYERETKKKLGMYWEKNRDLIEKTKKELEKQHKKRRKSKKERKTLGKKPKIELFLDTNEGIQEENAVEYLPFLGVTTIRLRLVVNEKIDEVIIRPMFTPDLFSPNVEWNYYVCGMNNENADFDLRKGFMVNYGGGEMAGFVVRKPPPESYVFFFLRHHDKSLGELKDFSITFGALEEVSKMGLKVHSQITIKLKYPEDILPPDGRPMPDLNDPLCPIHANYDYDYFDLRSRRNIEYREILFKGNMIPDYYPRWIPQRKIKYSPVQHPEKISNIVIRSYQSGDLRMYYKIEGKLHEIGHLKGSLTPAVFHDPMLMTTAEIFRFYSDDFVAVRVWFWWIDLRINTRIRRNNHEMPDFERVDFIIDLRNPTKDGNIIPIFATDVHWKEFWLDSRKETKVIDVYFTDIGINLVDWQHLKAYTSHHVGDTIYNPIPAIVYELFNGIGDPEPFLCIHCNQRSKIPVNVPEIKKMVEDLGEQSYKQMTTEIIEEMTDIVCPKCQGMIVKEEKLQYMFLYRNFSQFKKNIQDDILKDVLKKKAKTDAAGKPLNLGAIAQNCHVPTPHDGVTSNEWISSTVIKPLSLSRREEIEERKLELQKLKIERLDVSVLEGLNTKIELKLNKLGIKKLKDLINADLEVLRNDIDVSDFNQEEKDNYFNNIERWKQMAELFNIKGVGTQYADLLVEVGENLDTLRRFDGDPEDLLDKIEDYNEMHNDVSRLPSLKNIIDWIEQARAL